MAPRVRSPTHQAIGPYKTCATLELPSGFTCSVCAKSNNPLMNKQKPRKTERCKSVRRQCKKLWNKSCSTTLQQTAGEKKLHRLQCRWLNVEPDPASDNEEDTVKLRKDGLGTSQNETDKPKTNLPFSKTSPPPALVKEVTREKSPDPSPPLMFPWHTIRKGYEGEVETWLS